MTEGDLTELFFGRSEEAVMLAEKRYGKTCRALAKRILGSYRDAEEAANDALLAAWNSIPPNRPKCFEAYLYALTRRISIDALRRRTRLKRGGNERAAALEELSECIPSPADVELEAERAELRDKLNAFLDGLPEKTRRIFLQRYWWAMSAKEIAAEAGMKESAVRMQLLRTREKLKEYLEKEVYCNE